MRLDVGTLAFSTAVLSLALAATMLFIAHGRGSRVTRLCFSGSAALYGAGVLLIVFWPHHAVSLITGNTLVMASAICAHAGACTYSGRQIKPAYYALGVAGVILGLSLSFLQENGGVATRIFVISAFRVPYFIHAAHTIFSSTSKLEKTPAAPALLILMFISFSTLLILRMFDISISERHLHSFVDGVGFQAIYYLIVGMIMLSMVITFTLMCGEEEERHLHQKIDSQTRELRAAMDQAEQASAAKSRFIAAASHDLRQPVHALRLLTSAAEGLVSANDAELSDLVAEMKKSTSDLADYLHALLDVSRLDADVIVPAIRDVSADILLSELEAQFEREAIAADVRLHVIANSSLIRTDPLLLKRVLANLISNAIKFAEGGVVLVGCRRKGDSLEIQVWDNGRGIEQSAIGEIFHEFRQIGNNARQKSKGLGLGLSIVRRLCILLEHPIRVSSQFGQGTVFAVGAPLANSRLE